MLGLPEIRIVDEISWKPDNQNGYDWTNASIRYDLNRIEILNMPSFEERQKLLAHELLHWCIHILTGEWGNGKHQAEIDCRFSVQSGITKKEYYRHIKGRSKCQTKT